MSVTEVVVKHTEASMLRLLRDRHAKDSGNGPAWAYMEHVRDNSGFDAKRTCDALALHLWKSRGHELHGYEVKISKSDWRRELADPDKAEGWCKVVDRWWIVAPRGIVDRHEIPPTWGLLETRGDGLTVTVQAPVLRPASDRPEIPRTLLSCMLRAAGAGLSTTPDDAAIQAARTEGWEQGRKDAVRSGQDYQALYEQSREHVNVNRAAVREIENVLGQPLGSWKNTEGETRVQEVARALKAVLSCDSAELSARRRLEQAANELERAARTLRAAS